LSEPKNRDPPPITLGPDPLKGNQAVIDQSASWKKFSRRQRICSTEAIRAFILSFYQTWIACHISEAYNRQKEFVDTRHIHSIRHQIGSNNNFSKPKTSGSVPDGCKYFLARTAPQVVPIGPKVHNQKVFDLFGHLNLKLCPIESTKKTTSPYVENMVIL